MCRILWLLALCVTVVSPLPATAQSGDAVPQDEIIQMMARQTALIESFETIGRLSEELVFWQSVATMGQVHGWEFSYNTGGGNEQSYTLRLYNSLDESGIEAVRAMQAIERNAAATGEDRSNAATINDMHLALRDLATQVYDHLLADDTDAAAALFEAEVLALRRRIATRVYSAGDAIRDRTARIALDARLGRFPAVAE